MATKENGARLRVRVTPGAPRNEVTGYAEGVLRVKIAAPPVEGKANKELVAFVAEVLGVKKEQLSIIKGETNRNKVLAIDGLSQEQLELKLRTIHCL